jgi:hypothetical protein
MGNKMRRKYFILFPLCVFFTVASGFAQTNNHAVTFFGHIKLGKIPTSVGIYFMGKQFCTTQVDSIIHADRYFFENVTIGKIKSCKLDFAMRNDTIQSITIYLTGQKNYDAALKQAKKEFGPAVVLLNNYEEALTWLPKDLRHDVQVTLQRKNLEWGSEMIIKEKREE